LLLAQGLEEGSYTSQLFLDNGSGTTQVSAGQVEVGCSLLPGCTAPSACNYDPEANFDDGSCSTASDGSVDGSVSLHVYPLEVPTNVVVSLSCLAPSNGQWFCFRAPEATAYLTAWSLYGDVDFELYNAALELLLSSDDFEEDTNVSVAADGLVFDEVYYFKILLNNTATYGPRDVEVSVTSESGTFLPEDLDENGLVTATDLLFFLGEYGGTSAEADFNGDGTVNTEDLLQMLYAAFSFDVCN
jgi:hypothetical protein